MMNLSGSKSKNNLATTKTVKRENKKEKEMIATHKIAAPLLLLCAMYEYMKNTDQCRNDVQSNNGEDEKYSTHQRINL